MTDENGEGWLFYLGTRRPGDLTDQGQYADIVHDKATPKAGPAPAGVAGFPVGRTAMGDIRGEHWAAVHAAIDAVGVLQGRLAMATEQSDVALGAILSCTGSTRVESGQNALNAVAEIKARIDELFGMANVAVAELERYAGGF